MSKEQVSVDAETWELAVYEANKRLDPSEQDWASWKCDGGPHITAIQLGRTITNQQAIKMADDLCANASSEL